MDAEVTLNLNLTFAQWRTQFVAAEQAASAAFQDALSLGREVERLRVVVERQREAGEWVLYVASGIGKDGGPPSPAERVASDDALRAAIEAGKPAGG